MLNLGEGYEHLVMVGQDRQRQRSYGHDHYFTAWNAGDRFCVGARAYFMEMYKEEEMAKVKGRCRNSCGNMTVTTNYYMQEWDVPKEDDLKVLKYIKVHVKSEDGNGGSNGNGNGDNNNFGNVAQAKPVMILAFMAVSLLLGIANE